VRCAVADRVPDCTERENMRRYGTGDLFFSYQSRVCAVLAGTARTRAYSATAGATYSAAGSGSLELSGMGLSGGVGQSRY
jgi:hypothetical protein